MSEMVERVARAIFFRGGEQDDRQWKHMQPRLRELAIEQARAAIQAMREPSDGMVEAGWRAKEYGMTLEESVAATWPAMITAALGEGE